MQFKYHKINYQLNTCIIELNILYLHNKLTMVRYKKLTNISYEKLITEFLKY